MKNQNTSINMELEVKTREELTKVLKERGNGVGLETQG